MRWEPIGLQLVSDRCVACISGPLRRRNAFDGVVESLEEGIPVDLVEAESAVAVPVQMLEPIPRGRACGQIRSSLDAAPNKNNEANKKDET